MSKKILLADDSVTIQKVVSITLSSEDYDLTIVGDGEAALQKIREERPDLVIADVAMPGKNGYAVCEAVKKDPQLKDIPVLLLSGTFEPLNDDEARRVGADDHIAKPFESQDFLDKVKALLDKAPSAVSGEEPAAAAEQTGQTEEQPWGTGDFLGPVEEGTEDAFKLDTDFLGGVSFDEPKEEGAGEEGFVDLKFDEEEEKKEEAVGGGLVGGPVESVEAPQEETKEQPPLEVEPPSGGQAEEPEPQAQAEETPSVPEEAAEAEKEEPAEQPGVTTFEEETTVSGEAQEAVEPPTATIEPSPESTEEQESNEPPAEQEFEIEGSGGDYTVSWPQEPSGDIEPEPVSEEPAGPEQTPPAIEEPSFEPVTEALEEEPAPQEESVHEEPQVQEEAVVQEEPAVEETVEVQSPEAPAAPVAEQAPEPEAVETPEAVEAAEPASAPEPVEEKPAPALAREEIEEIVKKTSREVIEQIAWEVIPEMAEEFIKSEFDRIREAIAKAR